MYQSKNYIVPKTQAATMNAEERSNVIIVDDMSGIVNLFVSGIVYVSALNTNIQGDIDTGGAPRQNPCNQKGMLSSPGYKRKIRDSLQSMYGSPIHVARRGVLLQGTLDAALAKCTDQPAVDELSKLVENQRATIAASTQKNSRKSKKGTPAPVIDAADIPGTDGDEADDSEESSSRRDWTLVKKANHEYFIDDRTFGRLFTDPINDGDTGPVQISHFQTLHPIEILELAVGCTAVANYKEKATKNNTIGRMSIVNFGLYGGTVTCNPRHAVTTGFTWNDLNMLLNTIPILWDLSQSASRTGVSHERLYLFVHDSAYGSAPLNKLAQLVKPKDLKVDIGADAPRQSMDDYRLVERKDLDGKLPNGVKLITI